MYPMYCPQNYFSYLIFIRRSMKFILYERRFTLAWPESTCCYTQGKDTFPCPDFKQWWLPQRGKWQPSSGTQVQLSRHIAGFILYGVASTSIWGWIYSRWPVHTFQWLTSVTEALALSAFPATPNIFSKEWRYWVSHLLEPLKLWNIYYLENTPSHQWRPLVVSKFYLT